MTANKYLLLALSLLPLGTISISLYAIALFSLTWLLNSTIWRGFCADKMTRWADAAILRLWSMKRRWSHAIETTRAGSRSCSVSPDINESISGGRHSGQAACQAVSSRKPVNSMRSDSKTHSTCACSRGDSDKQTLHEFLCSPIGRISALVPALEKGSLKWTG